MGPRVSRGRGITASSLGVDLGGTKVLAVRVDRQQKVIDRATAKTHKSGPAEVADQISNLLSKLDPDRRVEAVGVGVPGVVVGSNVERAVNLVGWESPVDFGSLLSGVSGRRVHLANDVSMALVAEHQLGRARGVGNVLQLSVGTGVGGALMLDGRLRHGPHGLAGEFGHMEVPGMPRVGPGCSCGGHGHLEAYLGRSGLERRARAHHVDGESTMLIDRAGDRRITTTVWIEALEAGDLLARRLLDEATTALSRVITAAVTTLDIELVVLSGGFASRLGADWRATVSELHADAMTIGAPASVVGTAVGDDAAAIGAAISHRD